MSDKFKLLAGPCVIESEEMVMSIAEQLKAIAERKWKYSYEGES